MVHCLHYMARSKKLEAHTGQLEAAPTGGVVPRVITKEMRESYLNYAMSVITARALPDIRDGLKPVHRRILYSMLKNGLTPSARFQKSAKVVGDVIAKYHPHGDAAVYDAMVKLAQDFTTRYPLISGQGNFGSIDGDGAAAYRYTEAKMSKLALQLVTDLEKNTVNFRPNFDNSEEEPEVLPAGYPQLLVNGTLGIAVGMATNIPPHNLGEVCTAAAHLIDNPEATTSDLLEIVAGPDFPTGCMVYNQKEIEHVYTTGRGGLVVRGETEIIEDKKGNFSIIITSIPFRVVKADMLQRIADLVNDKKLEGIKDVRDESTTDIRVYIELKGTAHPQTVLNNLYKMTQLEETFHYNMLAIVDGIPQTLSLKEILVQFVKFRKEIVTRRTKFDLDKARAREHILLGLKKALDIIEQIIKLIRASKDVPTAHKGLMDTWKFSDLQATAILEMRLQKLANLERIKIEEELAQLQKLIAELESLLASDKKMMALIKKEVLAVGEAHADERRTKVMKRQAKTLSAEDLIPDEESVLVLSKGGYIKRTNPDEYRKQKRGGVGVVDLETKDEDFVMHMLKASTHNDLLFFSDKGRAYQLKMYEIPEGRRATKGKSIVNFLSISSEERITSVLTMPKEAKEAKNMGLVLVTKKGVVKKTMAEAFFDVRRSGLAAINLESGDELIAAMFAHEGDSVMLITSEGQSIRFDQDDVRAMGRAAAGVTGMKLDTDDFIIGAGIVPKGARNTELLVISACGYGKKTPVKEYKTQNRAGSGIKTADVTVKTGAVVGAAVVSERGEVVTISRNGQVIRLGIDEVPSQSRQTQGVRIMKLREGDKIASLVVLGDEALVETEEE
jgi:DNA gyrase subunit A